MLSKGITVDVGNVQAIIVACAVLHNICCDRRDVFPNEAHQNMDDDIAVENAEPNGQSLRGRQERERVIEEHFSNLQ